MHTSFIIFEFPIFWSEYRGNKTYSETVLGNYSPNTEFLLEHCQHLQVQIKMAVLFWIFFDQICLKSIKMDQTWSNWISHQSKNVTAKKIWDSSIFFSIKPKLDMRLFVDFCAVTNFWLNLLDLNLKLFCFDV